MLSGYKRDLFSFYKGHLFNQILPFWLENAIDYECGGYYNCFDNISGKLVSTDKFTLSQGRFVWLFSKLADIRIGGISGEEKGKYLSLAGLGADFIMKNCISEAGHCFFLVDRKGGRKELEPGMGYYSSIYSDMFAVSGISEYARAAKDKKRLDFAVKVYETILERLKSGDYGTYPYPVPPGYKNHGVMMITLNTSHVLYEALAEADHPKKAFVLESGRHYLRQTLSFIIDGMMLEFLGTDGKAKNTLLSSYVNPGHCLEDIWFIIRFMQAADNCGSMLDELAGLAKTMYRIGWDAEHGGFYLFVSKHGGKPEGVKIGGEAGVMEDKVDAFWDHKLWWVHSEALYVFLLLYTLTGDVSFQEMHDTVKEYVFKTFPHPNPNIGEWIQIRDREGRPVKSMVALPVKDPFHIIRNLVFMIELLNH